MSYYTGICHGQGVFWFRVLGYGLWFKLRRLHQPLFSERYGYRKVYYFGPLVAQVLRP